MLDLDLPLYYHSKFFHDFPMIFHAHSVATSQRRDATAGAKGPSCPVALGKITSEQATLMPSPSGDSTWRRFVQGFVGIKHGFDGYSVIFLGICCFAHGFNMI